MENQTLVGCDTNIIIEFYKNNPAIVMCNALIAATALHYDIPLYTLNLKKIRPITGLSLYQPV
jgi:predicted nucleic acid-binding protein